MGYYLSVLKYPSWKKILAMVMLSLFVLNLQSVPAAAKKVKAKVILYVPHDNRPISDKQTVAVAEKAGVVIKVPPEQLLGTRTSPGDPDGLYQWVMNNAQDADAAVISSDALLYGSLVASRKHSFDRTDILKRTDYFISIHKKYPKLPVYVFSSIMRTPKNAAASGTEEPSYYQTYGDYIFQYTALLDKNISQGLTSNEEDQMVQLRQHIPLNVIDDWMGRRRKNFDANKVLVELTRNNIINYLVVGCDDNAPFSQTHNERVVLSQSAQGMSSSNFRIVAGVDEMGLLLITRAINKIYSYEPVVAIGYASGYGGATIPSYSDEPIDNSVRSEIDLAGGRPTTSAKGASMILLVNTNVSGMTYEAGENLNSIYPRANTNSFVNMIEHYLGDKTPVAIGDIAFANGADNALMHNLLQRNLLFKLTSYAGWNTATNSTGWSVGQGLLSLHMTDENKNMLLLTRYVDDWFYQANVRQTVARKLNIFPGRGSKLSLGDKLEPAQIDAEQMTQNLFDKYMPFLNIKAVKVNFPWNRLFESDIQISQNPNEFVEKFFRNYK
ncbi:DUF4127 family protein [Pectinatus haikarae]|uniref:DUF4127 family protein n=1 Tax=Pectinatus haikarae TaxID=349096 RepID=UPI0018C6E5E8|nr:DUF4127 family protein [Pectinatus haikarae]